MAGFSIQKRGTEADLNPLVPPVGYIWYAADTHKYVIGDGVTTFQNLQKYTEDELRSLLNQDHPLYNLVEYFVTDAQNTSDINVDGGDLG